MNIAPASGPRSDASISQLRYSIYAHRAFYSYRSIRTHALHRQYFVKSFGSDLFVDTLYVSKKTKQTVYKREHKNISILWD